MAELKDKLVNLEDLKVGVNEVCLMQETTIKKVKSLTKAEYDAIAIKDANTLYHITDDAASADVYTKAETDALLADKADVATTYTKTETDDLLTTKLDASKSTIQTTAPTEAITDGGIHIVHLASETGVVEYDGYIYMYDED